MIALCVAAGLWTVPWARAQAGEDPNTAEAVRQALAKDDLDGAAGAAGRLRQPQWRAKTYAEIATAQAKHHLPLAAKQSLATALAANAAAPRDNETLAALATAQAALGQIAAARQTLGGIRIDLRHPQYDLVAKTQGLTALAGAQVGRHDRAGARRTLREALALTEKISGIFVEMGDGPSSWTANAYREIALVYGTLHDAATAKRLLRKAGTFAGGQNSPAARATDLGALAQAWRQLGEAGVARHLDREARIAQQMEGDIPSADNRRRAEIVIRAEDGDVEGALRAARQEKGENRFYVLCAVAAVQARRKDLPGAHATYAEARTVLDTLPASRYRDELRTSVDQNEARLPQ